MKEVIMINVQIMMRVRRGNFNNLERSGDYLKWKRYLNCFEGLRGVIQMNGNNFGKGIVWENIFYVVGIKRKCGGIVRNKIRKVIQIGIEQWFIDDV